MLMFAQNKRVLEIQVIPYKGNHTPRKPEKKKKKKQNKKQNKNTMK
jgi:hypothetical protein